AGAAAGQVVSRIDGLTGDLGLLAGSNITITAGTSSLTISAPNALTTIAHDTTLQGNGAMATPPTVAVPLHLTGAVPLNGSAFDAVIKVTNTADDGTGISAGGSDSSTALGGVGIEARGGAGNTFGGHGVLAFGGVGSINDGGDGLVARGGPS